MGIYTALVSRTIFLGIPILIGVIYLFRMPAIRKRREALSVYLFGIGLAALFTFLFYKTPFGLNGYSGDAHYVIAAITKFQYYWSNVDFAYDHMTSYYPPLFFYLLGKMAWLLHIPGYATVKICFILAAFVLPVVTYHLWAPLIGKKPAVLVAVFFHLISWSDLIFKTYEFATCVLFLPWWLYFGERRIEKMWASKKARLWSLVLGGITGALLISTYYYWFFVIVIYMIVSFIGNTVGKFQTRSEALRDLRHKFSLLVISAVLSSGYWIPVMYQALTLGWQNFQNRWVSAPMLTVTFFDQLSTPQFATLLMLVGLTYLVVSYPKSSLNRVILYLLVACCAWYFLGFLGIFAGTPNLHIKAFLFNTYVLFVGFALLFRDASTWQKVASYVPRLSVFATCVLILTLGQWSTDKLVNSTLYKNSLKTVNAPSEIQELDVAHPARGSVFLTDQFDSICFSPIFLFVGYNPNYANPSARYMDRVTFLSDLHQVQDAKAATWLLTYNKFDKVDYVWMKQNFLSLGVDNYPNGTAYKSVPFNMAYEQSPYFTRVQDTDIYQVHSVSVDSYQQFDLTALAVAATFGEKSLHGDVQTQFQNRLATETDRQVLDNVKNIVSGQPLLRQMVQQRIQRLG